MGCWHKQTDAKFKQHTGNASQSTSREKTVVLCRAGGGGGGYTRKQRYRYTPVKNSIYCDFQTCIFFPLRTIENKKNKKLSSKNKQMINFDENTKEVKIYNIYTYYMTFMVYVQKIFMYHS